MKNSFIIILGVLFFNTLYARIINPFPSDSSTAEIPDFVDVSGMGGNGHAQSWDGKLFIITKSIPVKQQMQDGSIVDTYTVGWVAKTFRPQNVMKNNGALSFPNQGNRKAFSDDFVLEHNESNNLTKGDTPEQEYENLNKIFYPAEFKKYGMFGHNALAMTPQQKYRNNPYQSNAAGQFQENGKYRTYKVYLYPTHYASAANDETLQRVGDVGIQRVGQRKATIIVKDPDTDHSSIHDAFIETKLESLLTINGNYIAGLEPTLTMDGRLLVIQGPKNGGNSNEIDYLVYSWNPISNATTGWSELKSISNLYNERERIFEISNSADVKFSDMFPIAKKPMRDSRGDEITGLDFRGAYPWLSPDGHDIFFTAERSRDGAIRGAHSIIGKNTDFVFRHIDGPLNYNRSSEAGGDIRLFISSPGMVPGLWDPYRNFENTVIPMLGNKKIYPVFSSNTHNYSEIGMDDALDGNYVVYLHMNELIPFNQLLLDKTKTGDTSGQFNNADLVNGAVFSQEYLNQNVNDGIYGQAVFMPDSGGVNLLAANNFESLKSKFTFEIFFKALRLIQGQEKKILAELPGSFQVNTIGASAVEVLLWTESGVVYNSGKLQFDIDVNLWNALAFTFDAVEKKVQVFHYGELIKEFDTNGSDLRYLGSKLMLGNNGFNTSSNSWLFAIDEVKLSNVIRSRSDLRQASFYSERSSYSNFVPLTLPVGIDRKDIRVPISNPVTLEKIELGKKLFFDSRLSGNRQVSCASCHFPQDYFTDGLAKSDGLNGPLDRNTPTIMNRLLSTKQFFDGRAHSLEEQVELVIENPNEMNGDLERISNELNSSVGYVEDFNRAFGTRRVTSDLVVKAIATFERSLLSANSRYDQYINGNRNALNTQEKRGLSLFNGKGRCIACHNGSNLSDEAFHNLGFFDDDLGRFSQTKQHKDRFAHKTPSLRNIEMTGPYFHNGSVNSLEEVIALYNEGSGSFGEVDSDLRPLGLSDEEQVDLVSFLATLTSTQPSLSLPILHDIPGLETPSSEPKPVNPYLGRIDRLEKRLNGSVDILGWACIKRRDVQTEVKLQIGNEYIGMYSTTQPSEQEVHRLCGTSFSPLRFLISLDKSQAQRFKNMKVRMYFNQTNIELDNSNQLSIPGENKLVNISMLADINSDESITTGFVIQGASNKQLLIRGVGPTLTTFGVINAAKDPEISIFKGSIFTSGNNDWQEISNNPAQVERISQAVGAFELKAKKDAAMIFNASTNGNYSAIIKNNSNEKGKVLVEVYDANKENGELINLSARKKVDKNESLTVGFVVEGSPMKVLIRAIGPSLKPFGLSNFMKEPTLKVFNGSNLINQQHQWHEGVNQLEHYQILKSVGAFPYGAEQPGSFDRIERTPDAAIILTLEPGVYSAVVENKNLSQNSASEVMVEIYKVP